MLKYNIVFIKAGIIENVKAQRPPAENACRPVRLHLSCLVSSDFTTAA
jgi:hypothetical protein